jgi:hypothetical protein
VGSAHLAIFACADPGEPTDRWWGLAAPSNARGERGDGY